MIVFRERSHFDLARLFSALQDIVVEIARRLHERGHLPSPDDIFFLTEAEVRAWLGGQPPPLDDVKRLVRRRRDLRRGQRTVAKRAFPPDASASAGDVLRGNGASSGVVRGKARIIREEREFDRLGPGEILVCQYTNPA